MLKSLVIGAIFALGIAVGCSQNDGTTATATAVPEPSAPTVANTMGTNDPVLPAPTSANTTGTNDPVLPTPTSAATPAANAPEQLVAPANARQTSPAGRGFVPLDNPLFIAADETDYFGDEDLVLGVEFAGEVRAYPVRMLRYHHVVNDTVGGEPLLVTY